MKIHSYRMKPLAVSIATALAVGLSANAGFAQQRQIEEVVVTAERREATEQTTSISMEVFSQDMLSDNQIVDIRDLQDAMPGIQVQNNGVGSEIQIRGVGTNSFSPQVQMGVQVVNDGLTHGEPMGLNGAFFDVSSVEVLRGPQGTFIGQSAAGGAILINSASPDFDGVSGFVEGQLGNYQHNLVSGAINLPISDTWAARVAFRTEQRESFYKNLGGEVYAHGDEFSDPGELENRQVRLSLLWQPTQQFEALFKAERNAVDHGGDVRVPKRLPTTGYVIDPATGAPTPVVTYSQFREYSPANPYEVYRMWDGSDLQQNTQFSIRLSYEFANGMTVRTNSGFNDLLVQENWWTNQNGATRVPIFPDRFILDRNHSDTNEITLSSPEGPTNWIVGLFQQQRKTPVMFQNPSSANERCGWQSDGTHVDCGSLEVPSSYIHVYSPAWVRNRAIFGQYNYAINDELELAVGARWNMDWSAREVQVIRRATGGFGDAATCAAWGLNGTEFMDPQRAAGPAGAATPSSYGCAVVNSSATDIDDLTVDTDVPTYKIGLNWSPTDEDFLYVFYARGYKAATAQGQGVEPEQIDDIELGWKGSMMDGAFTGDLNFFFMDYTDLQGSAFRADDPLGADTQNGNLGSATIKGIEVSGQMFLGNLGINFQAAWTDSEIDGQRTIDEDALPAWAENDTGGQLDWLPQCGVGTLTLYGDNNPATASTGRVVDPVDPSVTIPNGNCFNYDPYWQNYAGQPMIRSPELSWNLAVDYQFQMGNGVLTPRLSFSHTDESYSEVNQSLYNLNEERDIMNFQLNYDYSDWNFQFYINNLTEEVYIASARADLMGYGDPRTYGLKARMNF